MVRFCGYFCFGAGMDLEREASLKREITALRIKASNAALFIYLSAGLSILIGVSTALELASSGKLDAQILLPLAGSIGFSVLTIALGYMISKKRSVFSAFVLFSVIPLSCIFPLKPSLLGLVCIFSGISAFKANRGHIKLSRELKEVEEKKALGDSYVG